MQLNYINFYRRNGLRLQGHLIAPPMHEIKTLELPMASIYHYVNYDGVELGPPSNDYLFRNLKKPIQVAHVEFLGDEKGSPKKMGINTQGLIRDYQMQHRRMRWMRNLEAADRDQQGLIVYNYCLLAKTYRYIHSFYTEYYKWNNIFATIMDTVVETTKVSERQHFIMAGSPKVIPSLQQLNLASDGMTQGLLKTFRDRESFLLMELYKWIGPNRETSLFHRIPMNKIHLVNLLFQESGQWTVVNLGQYNGFRRVGPEGSDAVIQTRSTLDPVQLQKRLLRMYMTVMEARTLASRQVDEDVVDQVMDDDEEGTELDNGDDGDDTPLTGAKEVVTGDTAEQAVEVQEVDQPEATQLEDEEIELTPEQQAQRLADEDAQLDEELAQLNEIARRQEEGEQAQEASLHEVIFQTQGASLSEGVMNVCDRLADEGYLSAGEYKYFQKQANKYKELQAPNFEGTLEEYIQIPPEMLKITESTMMVDSPVVFDKSMLKSSLLSFDDRYIEHVLDRDIAGMVLSLQHAGIAVTDYKVEHMDDVMGGYKQFTVRVNPVVGQQSTLRFKLPVVDRDGSYTSNGVKYRLRKQRGDLPIRKIAPTRVALTSYAGKAFVNRSKKRADDYGYWLQNRFMEKLHDAADQELSEVALSNVFDNELASPRTYSAMGMFVSSFTCKGIKFLFDHELAVEKYPPAVLERFETDGSLVVGETSTGYVVMDKFSTLYLANGDVLEPIGTLENFLGIDTSKAPMEFASLSVFGKDIPVGVILGLQMGFEKLMRLLKLEPRRVPAGTRAGVTTDEYALVFSDETLVFPKDDRFASMVMAGFNDYEKALRLFSVYSFDKRGVYVNLLETAGLGARYVREIDLMHQMFIDPITKDLLIEMKEPTTFQGLLLRSCEMLMSDQHPDELDPAYMRIKGYERLAGAVYTELVQSVRGHNGRMGKANASLEMPPYAVWKRVSEDPAKNQVSEINPIEALKEVEAVTFAGTGGRSKRSMTKHTRAFHRNDMGVISESTVDSSDVAVNVFTSADPQFTSLRGMSKPYVLGETGATALLSTSSLISPASDKDDPKRVNFVAIQQSHAIACDGYHQFMVRTGYDAMIAQRSHALFAYTAKKPGTVVSVDAKGIIVKYDDGKQEGYELGRRFGNAAGLVVPHQIVTTLKAGDQLVEGDTIVYNSGFFEPDFFNPKRVVLKNAFAVKTVLWESSQTLEDASSISMRTAGKLVTNITKVKTIVVNFDQTLDRLVKVGDKLQADSVLGYIQDAVTANSKIFDEESLDTLRVISAQTPRAGLGGVVEKIEVFYHGDKDDMSESLRTLANMGDRELKRLGNALGRQPHTGSVDGGFRIEGEPLPLDAVAVRIYITAPTAAGVGDKGVFSNQLKTVFSEVLEEDYVTEHGDVIDAVFSVKSINARIVNSPFILGTSMTLLKVIAKRAVSAYRGTLTKAA